MLLSFRLALLGAAGVAVIALTDAFTHGLTGSYSVFSDDYGRTGWQVAGSLVHGLMYAAIAWVLHANAASIEHGSRPRAFLRRLLVAASVLNAVFFGLVDPALWVLGVEEPPTWLAAAVEPLTLVFMLTFVLAFALGISVRRVPGMRPAALALMSIVPVIGATLLLAAAGEPLAGFAHPAYAEVVTNVGLALTGLAGARAGSANATATAADIAVPQS